MSPFPHSCGGQSVSSRRSALPSTPRVCAWREGARALNAAPFPIAAHTYPPSIHLLPSSRRASSPSPRAWTSSILSSFTLAFVAWPCFRPARGFLRVFPSPPSRSLCVFVILFHRLSSGKAFSLCISPFSPSLRLTQRAAATAAAAAAPGLRAEDEEEGAAHSRISPVRVPHVGRPVAAQPVQDALVRVQVAFLRKVRPHQLDEGGSGEERVGTRLVLRADALDGQLLR